MSSQAAVRFEAPAFAHDDGDRPSPRDAVAALDGEVLDTEIADFLVDDEATARLPVTGGRVVFAVDPPRVIVEYGISRPLSASEHAALTEYTRGQLIDGVGENLATLPTKGVYIVPDSERLRRVDDGRSSD